MQEENVQVATKSPSQEGHFKALYVFCGLRLI